jgi:glycosyltransferase involved in cell wall biosynthesis
MKNIGVIVFSYFPDDPRVKREADALAQQGMKVTVFCMQNSNEKPKEIIDGTMVIRMNLQRKREGKFRYLYEYMAFITWSTIMAARFGWLAKFDVIHVHNMPDILVISSVWPRLFGAKVVLDLHDPTPEMYMTKYNLQRKHPMIRFLVLLEKLAIRMADLVLTPNIAFQELFISRSCPAQKIHIIMNSPQDETFKMDDTPDQKIFDRQKNRFNLMYHGTIVERHGLDVALRAIALLREKIPGIAFHVFGSGDIFLEKFLGLIREMDLEDVVKYYGFVPLREIAKMITRIDVGIIPNRRTPFTDMNLPTRIFEYLCLKKPVVAPRTRGILDYFDESSLFLFEPGSEKSLATTIAKVYEDLTNLNMIVENGYAVYNRYRWDDQKVALVKLIDKI